MREYRSKWAEVYRHLQQALAYRAASDPRGMHESIQEARNAALKACRGPKRGRSLGVFVARSLDNVRAAMREDTRVQLQLLENLAAREAGLRLELRNRRAESPAKLTPFVKSVIQVYTILTKGIA